MDLTRPDGGVHAPRDEHGDLAGASLPETWIDEGDGCAWILYEDTRRA